MTVPRETFCEGVRDIDFLASPSEPWFGCVAVLGCVLGGEQSGEICTCGGLQQPGKAFRVNGHRQRGRLRDLEGFRFSRLFPLSLDVAV